MPTVRTHLRNLFAKTSQRGKQELTQRPHADAAFRCIDTGGQPVAPAILRTMFSFSDLNGASLR